MPAAWGEWAAGLLAAYGAGQLMRGLLARVRRAVAGWRPHRPFLSVLLAVRNKAAIVEGLVTSLASLEAEDDLPVRYELVVVDDRSTDETPRILERLARRYPHLHVASMAEMAQPGQSPMEVGLFLCSSPLVLVCDARGQFDPGRAMGALSYMVGARPAEEARPTRPKMTRAPVPPGNPGARGAGRWSRSRAP